MGVGGDRQSDEYRAGPHYPQEGTSVVAVFSILSDYSACLCDTHISIDHLDWVPHSSPKEVRSCQAHVLRPTGDDDNDDDDNKW